MIVPFPKSAVELSQLDAPEKQTPIVTQSADLLELIAVAQRVATSSASVLLTGESGNGKELFARLIHESSQRSANTFVKVNCAALPASLIESELFGHEKGSFTDAVQARVGRFELAHGGTLLLDEISEIPLATQAKLLRVLEENEFERVGSNETIRTDARILATSNRDLQEEIAAGRFRLDLFHRLNVIQLDIPSLRHRTEDIPMLVNHFVEMFRNESQIQIEGFSEAALELLASHHWPGNVRELRNVVHRACILTTEPWIDVDGLGALRAPAASSSEPELPDAWLHTKLADIEKQIIVAALNKYGNKRIVAEQLGVSARTLTNKLRIYRESDAA